MPLKQRVSCVYYLLSIDVVVDGFEFYVHFTKTTKYVIMILAFGKPSAILCKSRVQFEYHRNDGWYDYIPVGPIYN